MPADHDPNAGLQALLGIAERREPWPEVDTEEARVDYLRSIERDALNREPDS